MFLVDDLQMAPLTDRMRAIAAAPQHEWHSKWFAAEALYRKEKAADNEAKKQAKKAKA